MKIKSAFSTCNYLIPLVPVLIVLIIRIFTEEDRNLILFPPLGILLFLSIIYTVLYYTTYYEIQVKVLLVSLFFYKTKINVSEIRIIKRSNSLIKNILYKLGFHHIGIEIEYNKYDDIFISPKNKELFINQLLQRNPNIEIKQ